MESCIPNDGTKELARVGGQNKLREFGLRLFSA